jgi:putative transposase
MRTTMVLDAIEMARWSRGKVLAGLRCHSDAGSQFTSIRYECIVGHLPQIAPFGRTKTVLRPGSRAPP